MELGFLRPLYEQPGPWVSVYLDASRSTEDAAEAIGKRWRGVRTELARQGVDEATLAAVDAGVARPPRDGPHGYVLFASHGRLAMTVRVPAPPRRDTGTVGPLPHVVPLLTALGEPVPWVRAVVDRTGADLLSSPGWHPPWAGHVEGGEQWPMSRSPAGGWSQPRYQRAAIETWERNAADVAAAVVAVAERVDAEVLVLAGDQYARTLLVEQLPERWAPLAVQVEGSRAPGAKTELLDEATAEAIRAAAERRRAVELDNFSARRASGRARSDLDGVVMAARQGQVATLLLPPGGIEAPLWIGDAPTDVACAPDDLSLGDGTPKAREARADAALVRAVASADGKLAFTEAEELPGGVGAVLRYAT